MKTAKVSYAIIGSDEPDCIELDMLGEFILRDAIKELFNTRTNEADGITCIEANCYPLPVSGWLTFSPCITVYNSTEYRTGESENRSLSICGKITASSWRRLVKLIKSN